MPIDSPTPAPALPESLWILWAPYTPVVVLSKDTHAALVAERDALRAALERLIYFHETDDTPNSDPWQAARTALRLARGES